MKESLSEKLAAMIRLAEEMEKAATFLTDFGTSLRDMVALGEAKEWNLEERAAILTSGQILEQKLQLAGAALRSFSDPQGIASQALEVLRDPADDEIPTH